MSSRQKQKIFTLSDDYNEDEIFRIQMTPDQLTYLSTLLPQCHIFQFDNRVKRQTKNTNNKKKLLMEESQNSVHNTESAALEKKSISAQNKSKVKNEKSKPMPNQNFINAVEQTNKENKNKKDKFNPIKQMKQHQQQQKMDDYSNLSDNIKHCGKILDALKKHKDAWPFCQPVDPVALGVPNYFQIIKQPMDLATIQSKLLANIYSYPQQFNNDVYKIIENSLTFNASNPQFIKITNDFEKGFQSALNQFKPLIIKPQHPQKKKPIEKPPKNNPPNKEAQKKQVTPVQKIEEALSIQNISQASNLLKPVKAETSKGQKKKKKQNNLQLQQIIQSQPVTTVQKLQLATNIKRLAKQHLKGIISIVFDGGQQPQDSFDLQQLSQKKLRDLQKYVRNKIAIMEHTIKLSQQQRHQNPDTNDLRSQQESFILDSQ